MPHVAEHVVLCNVLPPRAVTVDLGHRVIEVTGGGEQADPTYLFSDEGGTSLAIWPT